MTDATQSTERPLPHQWDEDGCCIHCGYDGAEAWHQVKFCGYEKTDADRWCEVRAEKARKGY